MAERWTAAQVNSLAPDAPSQKAGAKLGVPGPWSDIGYQESEKLLWGDCKGSGSKRHKPKPTNHHHIDDLHSLST